MVLWLGCGGWKLSSSQNVIKKFLYSDDLICISLHTGCFNFESFQLVGPDGIHSSMPCKLTLKSHILLMIMYEDFGRTRDITDDGYKHGIVVFFFKVKESIYLTSQLP